jgi:hypothetical protein
MIGLAWYPVAVRSIREAFERRRLNYSEAIEAVQEVGRMIGVDADIKPSWRVTV